MAGDYRHERCQLLSIKANPATDETEGTDLPSQILLLGSFDQCKSVLSASSAVRFNVVEADVNHWLNGFETAMI
jgi:hypothetical protein